MKARIMMIFEEGSYEYGTYLFNTNAEKIRVNELAMKVREERGCHTYIEEVGGIDVKDTRG